MKNELKELYKADQQDRQGAFEDTDWESLRKEDKKRLTRVNEFYKKSLIKTAEDMFYAAMIFQHGRIPKYFKQAMELSKKSWELGSKDGKWLYPRAEDRYLLSLGKAQIWGTQFIKEKINEPWKLQEPFDKSAKTDKERKSMGINIKVNG